MIVWSFLEVQIPAVVDILDELVRQAFAQLLNRRRQLLFSHFLDPLHPGGALPGLSLPGQRAPKEVQQIVAQRFHVIAANRLEAFIAVD